MHAGIHWSDHPLINLIETELVEQLAAKKPRTVLACFDAPSFCKIQLKNNKLHKFDGHIAAGDAIIISSGNLWSTLAE